MALEGYASWLTADIQRMYMFAMPAILRVAKRSSCPQSYRVPRILRVETDAGPKVLTLSKRVLRCLIWVATTLQAVARELSSPTCFEPGTALVAVKDASCRCAVAFGDP
jgi:hypothetical protein